MVEVTQANITLEDVRQALADTDPNATNASRLRALIGRGSLATIQKHLDAIRVEQAPQPLQSTTDAPVAPKDLIQGLWSAAWQSAQAQTAGALAAALAKLAVTEKALSVARSDSEDAQGAADIAVAVMAKDKHDSEAVVAALAAERDAALAAVTDLQAKSAAAALAAVQELATVKAEASLQAERAAAASSLQEAKHLAAVELMRSEMDRLVNQLADLRAALSRPVQPA